MTVISSGKVSGFIGCSTLICAVLGLSNKQVPEVSVIASAAKQSHWVEEPNRDIYLKIDEPG